MILAVPVPDGRLHRRDVLMSSDHRASTAVISVGGFWASAASWFRCRSISSGVDKDKIVMPGATEASLNNAPTFRYNNA